VAAALGKIGGRIGDTKAVEPLIKLASKHTEDIITCMSVRALGDIGDHQAVEPLIAILDDEKTADGLHSHLRLETCWALRKLRSVKAVDSLIKIVEGRTQEESIIREAAASALVELDDDRIELPLLKFFKVAFEARAKLEVAEHQQDEVLEAVVKLIARLIKKVEMS
jgi:HEAT repeat protein